MRLCFSVVFGSLLFIACSSTKSVQLQTFTPVAVDLQLIDKGDFSQIADFVNKNYSPNSHVFTDAQLIQNGETFLYIKVSSSTGDGACYRVTVDKHRAAIINTQPDCSVEK